MKVCVVAEYYPRRRDPALGVWTHRQALATRAAGADVRVLVLERPVPPVSAFTAAARGDPRPLARALREMAAQPRRDVLDGLPVEYVRFIAPARERAYATWHRWARRPLERALERLDDSWGIDLVHAHYVLPAGGAARRLAARRGKPLVVSVHGGDVLGRVLSGPPARARVGGVLRAADAVLCNSRATLERSAALAGSEGNMRVVHLGAGAPETSDRAEPRAEAGPLVATVGNLIARKRHADMVRALHLLAERLPGIRWRVIGDGPERDALQALATEVGVATRIDWLGRLPPGQALAELARCQLMAMPSVDEAFGVAYVEALACGLPAIGCRGEGGPEEIARLGDAMILVPPGDPEALARAIEAVLADRDRLRELSAAARRMAAEHFSWERCGQATVAAYEDALAGARG
jgi:teichuronic acid biosynthesis glycosyltransferase TuaC